MEDILELLANYGPMTASELSLELDRNLRNVEHELSLSSCVGCSFGSYRLLEKE